MASLLPGARGGTLIFYEESLGGTVAVVEQQAGPDPLPASLHSGRLELRRCHALVTLYALAGPLATDHSWRRAALSVGHRTWDRHHCWRAAALPRLEQRVCAELLPAVIRAAPLFQGNFGAASDPRIEIRVRDGRRELLRNPAQYDLITLEPPPPSAAGVVNLYSSDFYALASTRLRQDGLLAQWWPLPTQNDEDSRSLVRSFLDVFPHASLWTTEFHEMLLIGSFAPIELDAPRIAARFDQPEVAAALREVGIASPAALLATWVMDRASLERYVEGAPPVTDDQPRIEYATWVRQKELGRVLPRLLALRTMLPLRGADDVFLAAVADERDRLLRFYGAGLHAYNGERQLWVREMQQVMSQDGRNPYYRWFVGGDQ